MVKYRMRKLLTFRCTLRSNLSRLSAAGICLGMTRESTLARDSSFGKNRIVKNIILFKQVNISSTDSGGSRISRRGACTHLGGREPLTQVLFGENVCENERIGSHREACIRHAPLDPPMTDTRETGYSS